ncbi:MAG: Asp-tRNA(Asn)/Glu-tRNA(Gln) amidotransferase subunit GatA [Flammeovirgaceae bacterium]|nr:Asp-tRNA(Asn)/Glu-tRNA(Gln) amidotransferase subunit GatA [Flammeovirgaceae bacterium]MDW8286737.1 Asp-tRNA(Asn)/Glu-tRNA(Gln) amidotransferase subunit GatA [Flammeovirgaceae bacterium]
MYSSYKETRAALERKETTCRQLVEYYLNNIRQKSDLNIFLEVYSEEALQRADEIDQKLASGKAGKLAGMVVGLKDVIAYEGHRLQASSKILEGYRSPYSATATLRLLAEDAIIIGRQSCDEFAMGSSNENSAFGAVKNPLDPTRVPGGSSGASAAAVAADMCLASLGSDTGGSVRQPAAFCGIVGLKPTYSRISRHGLIAYGSSFDTIGFLTKNVEDAALLLEVVAGKDEHDATVSQRPVPAYTKMLRTGKKYKVGYIKETIESEGNSPEVRERTLKAIELLRKEGHHVEPVSFKLLEYILPTYYILVTAEASTNLSRYDGVRYGYRSPNATDLESMYKRTRSEGFGEEVKKRILLGTFVLSASYYDAYFTKAQKVRRLIKEETNKMLSHCDFLLSPMTPDVAFKLGQFSTDNPVAMYLEDLYTVQANVAGIPAISIPNGKGKDSMPIGLQIMTNVFQEEKLLDFASELAEKLKQI